MTRTKKILKKASNLVGMCLLLGIVGAQAATLTVTTTADNGSGSLRQAIIDAASNGEADTVGFKIPVSDPGYDEAQNRFTITLASSLPDIPLGAITISNDEAQALTVRGNDSFRILTLVNSAVLTINNLTISHGAAGLLNFQKSMSGGTEGFGGGIYMGDSSTLTLNKCVVSSNSAVDGGGIYINDSGTLHIDNSTFSNNTAFLKGGAIFNNTSGTINIDNTTVSGNSASDGGGIYNNSIGTINASSSTFDGNSASASGGGIYNAATMTLTNNTVSSNTAGTSGGGIYNGAAATLNNNLVALNTAPDGSDLLGRGDAGNAYTGSFNLIGNADGSEGLEDAPNQSGTTDMPLLPMLGPLQNNGGRTLTRALLSGSPAIDKGQSATLTLDQRGVVRPYDNMMVTNTGDGADIGAYESHLAPTSAEVSVGGRVLFSEGDNETGVSGATVTLTALRGETRTARTNAFGFYNFEEVSAGETYILDVRHKPYQFTTQVVTVFEDLTGLNFFTLQVPANSGNLNVADVAEVSDVAVSLPKQNIKPKVSEISVPITIGDLTGRNVIAFDFEVRFDPNVLRPIVSAPTTNAGTLSSGFQITVNPYIPGRVIVSGFGIYPMSGEGTLLNLNFQVIGQLGSTSPLTWQMFMLNEGDPASITTDGHVTIISITRTPRI